jgi:hypothetical protein
MFSSDPCSQTVSILPPERDRPIAKSEIWVITPCNYVYRTHKCCVFIIGTRSLMNLSTLRVTRQSMSFFLWPMFVPGNEVGIKGGGGKKG